MTYIPTHVATVSETHLISEETVEFVQAHAAQTAKPTLTHVFELFVRCKLFNILRLSTTVLGPMS
jgi:hypothetical protein